MKRRVLMLALLLVLGAIVNVAVAWSFSIPDVWTERRWTPERDRYFSTGKRHGFDNTWVTSADKTLGGHHVELDCWDATNQIDVHVWVWELGWPLRAVGGEILSQNRGVIRLEEHALIYGGNADKGTDYALPYRPLPIGFAINTVFYAAVLWMLFAASFALRKRRRIKRGLCPKCAYPVGTNAVCTECGAAVAPPPKAATA